MKRPIDRATVKRKWSADASAGPLILLAEWMQKRLIQHAWPCAYVAHWQVVQPVHENEDQRKICVGVTFVPMAGRPPFTDAFWGAFDAVLRVVSHERRLRAYRDGPSLHLDGDWHVNKYNKIRPGPLPPPF